MYLQELVEVAIGLIFAWLILSIGTMQVQEWIASYLGWRAKDMEKAIRNMLGDPAWANQLYAHPLIQGLAKKAGQKPSYIPANKFAVALFDIVATADTDASVIQRHLHNARDQVRKAPDNLPDLLPFAGKWIVRNFSNMYAGVTNFLVKADITTIDKKYQRLMDLARSSSSSSTTMKLFLDELLLDTNSEVEGAAKIRNALRRPLAYSTVELINEYPQLKDMLLYIIGVGQKKKILPEKLETEKIETIIEKLQKNSKEIAEAMSFAAEPDTENALGQIGKGLTNLAGSNPTLHRALDSMSMGIQVVNKQLQAQSDKAVEMVTESEKRLAAVRKDAENWFDDVMARLSGWYKRKTQILAVIISFILAVIFNVDSINLAQTLWREPTMRQAYTSYIDEFVKANENAADKIGETNLEAVKNKIAELEIPLGWETTTYDGEKQCSIPASEEQVVADNLPFSDKDRRRMVCSLCAFKSSTRPKTITRYS